MQLRIVWGVFLLSFTLLFAQDKKPVEIDFLFNYYDQNGDHSAVTGGNGTEELNNIGTKVIVNVPLSENKALNVSLNADVYTSASSDNIDPVRTGASGQDLHTYGHIDYSAELPESNNAYSLGLGFSNEFDYNSLSFGGSYTISSKDENRQFSISTMNFLDNIKLIYPVELRNRGKLLSDNQRKTYSLSLSYSQVISKKLQMSFLSDFVYQKGLLSAPFNRVYFYDDASKDVERLPDVRIKLPLGFRVNYFISDLIVARLHYRYYFDTFDIKAHTLNFELPVRLNQTWAVIPFSRYHDQSAAKYFAPYSKHSILDDYYTSDYDLSGFSSYIYGVGVRYYPLEGIGGVDKFTFSRIDLRAGMYRRSDGLNSITITAGFSAAIH